MRAGDRRTSIARLIQNQGSVEVVELSQRFGVSESTIRRDLEQLEREGILRRTYGGAVAIVGASPHEEEPTLTAELSRIGQAAAGLVEEGETLFLGPGRTTLAVARHLLHHTDLTVITPALPIAHFLSSHTSLRIIVPGGQLDPSRQTLVGYLAEQAARELRADHAIISVEGIHLPTGYTAGDLSTAQILRLWIEQTPHVTIVADHSKWGRTGPVFLASLEEADTVVTDQQAPAAMVWDLNEAGVRVVQV